MSNGVHSNANGGAGEVNGKMECNGSDRHAELQSAIECPPEGSPMQLSAARASVSPQKSDGSPKPEGSPMQLSAARASVSPQKSDGSNASFEQISAMEPVEDSTFEHVMRMLRVVHYPEAQKEAGQLIEGKCKYYFEKDYKCEIVDNERALVAHYPFRILVPVAVKLNEDVVESSEIEFCPAAYKESVSGSVTGRIRSRFPVPVILFDNKFVCRSGSTTDWKSSVYEGVMNNLKGSDEGSWYLAAAAYKIIDYVRSILLSISNSVASMGSEMDLKNDAKLLRYLKVEHVCDLMVEYAKKSAAQLVTVSSSEIQHMHIYRSFKIEDVPYPGCEFFEIYSKAGRNPEGLMFDWTNEQVERTLQLSADLSKLIPDLDTTKMREWDLVEITKFYLKIMLTYLIKDKGGILIHCLSGWDRTPLFISLLRLSLWADGVVHKSLKYEEMAYLTVGYDWFLFGHNFPSRWTKQEEIMHFCFNFLKYITGDEFSITKMFSRLPAEERESRNIPDFEPNRRQRLTLVRQYVLDAYQEHVIEWARAGNVPPEVNHDPDNF